MTYKLLYISLSLLVIMALVTGAFITGSLMNSKLLLSCALITTLNTLRLLSGKNTTSKHNYEEKRSI